MSKKSYRVSHLLKLREWLVRNVYSVSENIVGIDFFVKDFEQFKSLAFDDHFRIFPVSSKEERAELLTKAKEAGRTTLVTVPHEFRVYTVYAIDDEKQLISVYFYRHGPSLIGDWIKQVKIDDGVLVYGPRTSKIVDEASYQRWIMIGDETAIPAILRKINETPGDKPLHIILELGNEEDKLNTNKLNVHINYVLRNDKQEQEQAIINQINQLNSLQSINHNTYVWIAMEANLTKSLRQYIVERYAVAEDDINAVGYWDKHKNIFKD